MEPESSLIKSVTETKVEQECPACGHRPLESIMAVLEIPMLGEGLETTLKCPVCGFKRADIILTEQSEPVRYTLEVESEEDVDTRVVRSTSGTIRIPELGITIEPGPASESFVSNIEGILMRVRDVLQGLEYEDEEMVRKRIDRIDEARKGSVRFTVILEDPYGNSAILSEKAKIEGLSQEEAKKLRKGEMEMEPG